MIGSIALLTIGASACNQIFGIDEGVLVDGGASDAGNDVLTIADGGPPCDAAITITQINHFINDIDTTPIPFDYTDASTAVVYVMSADGGVTPYQGTGTNAGSFTVNGVPPCAEYYVKEDAFLFESPTYVFTTSRALDLSQYFVANATGATVGSNTNTQLQINATGLTPWTNNNDVLGMWAPGAGFISLPQPAVTAGATSLSTTVPVNTVWNLSNNVLYILDTALVPDAAVMSGAVLSAVTNSATINGVSTPLDATTVVDAAFGPNGTPMTISMVLDHNAFASIAGDLNPNAQGISEYLFLDPNPVANLGYISGSPDLGTYIINNGNGALETVTFAIHNPFPAQWALDVSASFFANVPISIPFDGGTATTYPGFYGAGGGCMYGVADGGVLTPDGGPMAPLITPVRSPLINGKNMFTTQSGVGAQPLLSWSPPKLGTPTAYVLNIEQVVPINSDPATAYLTLIAKLVTSNTQVRVPPNLLQPGVPYIIEIDANYSAGIPSTSPLMHAWPECDATILSGVLTL